MGDTGNICQGRKGCPNLQVARGTEATLPLKNAHETLACSSMSLLSTEPPGRLG